MRRVRLQLLTVIVGMLVSVSTADADYKDNYRRGIQAVNQRNWSEAARFLRLAVAEQAKETGERILISGLDSRPYLPQFYLGLALFNSNNCAEALKAWQISESDGVVKRNGAEFNQLTRNRDQCQTRLANAAPSPATGGNTAAVSAPGPGSTTPSPSTTPAPGAVELLRTASASATTSIDRARQSAAQLGTIEKELNQLRAGLWQEADLGPAQSRAQALLTSADTKYRAGISQSNPAELREASDEAQRAAQQFDAVRTRGQARLEEVRRTAVATPVVPAGPTSAAISPPITVPPTGSGSGSIAEKSDLARSNSGARPPLALRNAAQQFFNADYQAAITTLRSVRSDASTMLAQIHLFRASSLYALYLLGGERDKSLARQAADDVREVKKLEPSLAPDKQVFSPRFLKFFSETRQ